MGMVDRYKKLGGFVQLLQVLETCGPKKYEQFMKIISEEDPAWAEAIKEKMITFDKIINWKTESVMEVLAQVNTLAMATALKSLSQENFDKFTSGLPHQEKRKIEHQMSEINPTPAEISSCMLKVVSETRTLFSTGALKVGKIDPQLVIPENYEDKLSNKDKSSALGVSLEMDLETITTSGGTPNANINNAAAAAEIEKMQKKLVLLTRELQSMKQENSILRDKLDKIRKIA